jgi:hypothetical protein
MTTAHVVMASVVAIALFACCCACSQDGKNCLHFFISATYPTTLTKQLSVLRLTNSVQTVRRNTHKYHPAFMFHFSKPHVHDERTHKQTNSCCFSLRTLLLKQLLLPQLRCYSLATVITTSTE